MNVGGGVPKHVSMPGLDPMTRENEGATPPATERTNDMPERAYHFIGSFWKRDDQWYRRCCITGLICFTWVEVAAPDERFFQVSGSFTWNRRQYPNAPTVVVDAFEKDVAVDAMALRGWFISG